jgi:hypothetical protein
MSDESVGTNTTRKGTNLIIRQGQTASKFYGNDPSVGTNVTDARDLKP